MLTRTNVQAFVFSVNPSFKVLILKRTPERSGYWQPVSGGIDNGEEPEATVVREVFEETGISGIRNIIDLDYTFAYKETKDGVLMNMRDICFAAEVNNIPDVQLSSEHEQYKWCSYTEAKEYLKWEHNLIALEKLMDIISNS
ncbi:MAG: NUDIX hydrolase [Bacillota bacterium]|jgi:dATP pyrophosphohydrolase